MSEINTQQNKMRRKHARQAWLERRQSPEVRERMARNWEQRHPSNMTKPFPLTVTRYGVEAIAFVRKPTQEVK
jgi:hypothetical protein